MKRPPRRLSARLVTPALLTYSYGISGSLIGAGCLISYFSVFWFHGLAISDILFTTNHHWTPQSPPLIASLIYKELDGKTQWQIYEQACAAWHICLVFSQIFNLLSCTTRRTSLLKHGIRNKVLVFAILIKIVLMFLIVFVPPLQWIVGVQPPPFFIWFIPFGVGVILLLINEVRIGLTNFEILTANIQIRKFFIRRSPNNPIVRLLRW